MASQFLHSLFVNSASKKRYVGLEVERIGVWPDGSPLLYKGKHGKPGASDLLKDINHATGWPLVLGETGEPIGMKAPTGKVSLEPGSQLEFSANPESTLHGAVEKVRLFEKQVDRITRPHGLRWLGIGVHPLATVADIDLIASKRYEIMNEYFPTVGDLGTSMMKLTSSVQLNLDYESEAEALEMLRVAFLLTPLSYALFGNSPMVERKVTPFLSYRGQVWQHTDKKRSGILKEALKEGYSFKKYVEYLEAYPLMFVQDSRGQFVAAHGKSLNDIRNGAIPGVVADETNQLNAVRELFTETRLKPGFVEVRSIDGQRPAMRYSAVAFWMGILYSPEARKSVLDKLGAFSPGWLEELQRSSLKEGLRATACAFSLQDFAEHALNLARAGLQARGHSEEVFLKPLERVVERKQNPADQIREKFLHEWKGRVESVLEHAAEEGSES